MDNLELLIPDKIVKSKRKSISLIIETDGTFVVRCPYTATQKSVNDFILRKANWIISKRLNLKNSKYEPLKVISNETIYICGKPTKLEIYNNNRVRLIEDTIYVPKVNSKQKLINFLKGYAKLILQPKLDKLSYYSNLSYLTMSISSAKTCWGSCSFKNNIHFTYKLIMCPESVIDYIIIHELCHTKIKNHSSEFWKLVQQNYPNYKQCEQWLKENKGIINVI